MSFHLEPKKIRSQSPDVTVIVGKGDNMQAFECYKIVLSFASPFFDAMLSVEMAEKNASRIELPVEAVLQLYRSKHDRES